MLNYPAASIKLYVLTYLLQVVKLALTVLECYKTNVRLLTYLNNETLLTCVENIELCWIKGKQKTPDENQGFN